MINICPLFTKGEKKKKLLVLDSTEKLQRRKKEKRLMCVCFFPRYIVFKNPISKQAAIRWSEKAERWVSWGQMAKMSPTKDNWGGNE